MRHILAALALAGARSLAHVRDLGQYAEVAPEVRAWYRNADEQFDKPSGYNLVHEQQ